MNSTHLGSLVSLSDDALIQQIKKLVREKLLRIKEHFAHRHPNMSLNDLLHQLCDEKLESLTKLPSAPKVKIGSQPKLNSQAEIKRQVWQRDKHQCTNCGSTHAIEIDHVIPKAVGGSSLLKNQRLLCRSCNQRAAIDYFGMGKMAPHLGPTIHR